MSHFPVNKLSREVTCRAANGKSDLLRRGKKKEEITKYLLTTEF